MQPSSHFAVFTMAESALIQFLQVLRFVIAVVSRPCYHNDIFDTKPVESPSLALRTGAGTEAGPEVYTLAVTILCSSEILYF